MGTVSTNSFALKLKNDKCELLVTTMVLHAEMGRLPVMNVLATCAVHINEFIACGESLFLLMERDDGTVANPLGVSQWFIQSATRCSQASGPTVLCLRLGCIPGQHLSIRGYVSDNRTLQDTLKNLCEHYIGKCSIQNMFAIGEKLSDADNGIRGVVSVDETMEQLLRRIAQAADCWFWIDNSSRDKVTLQWQNLLQGKKANNDFDIKTWKSMHIASRSDASYEAVQKFYPTSSTANIVESVTASKLFTLELSSLLTSPSTPRSSPVVSAELPCEFNYYLSDQLSHMSVWPGIQCTDDEVAVGTLHVYDQSEDGSVRRLLGRLVPGIRDSLNLPSLPNKASFGVLAITTKARANLVSASEAFSRFDLLRKAGQIGESLGIPSWMHRKPLVHMKSFMLATVCPWDKEKNTNWVAGQKNGSSNLTTEVKVRFDFSTELVRLPFAYPMSGGAGLVFSPPAVDDRVLVLFHDGWPMVAFAAYQSGDVVLPEVLKNDGNLKTLSAPRGIVIDGGMTLCTSETGDLIIHAGKNLVLKAKEGIYLDAKFLREKK